ncbi:hypothetical protein BpHYR1_022844 [Brachionus plicatilis]|uniref:Uncharacterized protein n=1 Tax=Brachionus plicatilis TaxID=10195 RepID=A0A3M7Q0T5_BRAPC|nr:hypothetical protein BpHYR1_022844 [Brachionus plicatilis]
MAEAVAGRASSQKTASPFNGQRPKIFFWTVLWPAGLHTVGRYTAFQLAGHHTLGSSVGRPLYGRFLFWPIIGRPPHGFLKFGRPLHGRSVLWPALERSAILKTVHRRSVNSRTV